MTLPDYTPPASRRAALAAGAAPLLVLVAFTLIVVGAIQPDTGFAVFAACIVWVLHEMDAYQTGIDAFNAEYVQRHLSWRSTESLQSLLQAEGPSPETKAFVRRYVDAGRVVLNDGQVV